MRQKPTVALLNELLQTSVFRQLVILYLNIEMNDPFQHRSILVVPFQSVELLHNFVLFILNTVHIELPVIYPSEFINSLNPNNKEWTEIDVPLIVAWMQEHQISMENFCRIPFGEISVQSPVEKKIL